MRNLVNYSGACASREIESRNGRIDRAQARKINTHTHTYTKGKNAFFLNDTEPQGREGGRRWMSNGGQLHRFRFP